MSIKCIFCDHESASIEGLRKHSERCDLHPLYATNQKLRSRIVDLREIVIDMVSAGLDRNRIEVKERKEVLKKMREMGFQ